MSVALTITGSIIFVVLIILAFWLIFFKSGPAGATGPPGPAGQDAVPLAANNLAINSIFQLANSRICTIGDYVFLTPNINYNQNNLIFSQGDPTKSFVLSFAYDSRLPPTLLFGVTNATSQPLYLNMIGFVDINGLPFSTYQPTLPNGGCNSTVDSSQFSPYFVPPYSSTLMTANGNRLNY